MLKYPAACTCSLFGVFLTSPHHVTLGCTRQVPKTIGIGSPSLPVTSTEGSVAPLDGPRTLGVSNLMAMFDPSHNNAIPMMPRAITSLPWRDHGSWPTGNHRSFQCSRT